MCQAPPPAWHVIDVRYENYSVLIVYCNIERFSYEEEQSSDIWYENRSFQQCLHLLLTNIARLRSFETVFFFFKGSLKGCFYFFFLLLLKTLANGSLRAISLSPPPTPPFPPFCLTSWAGPHYLITRRSLIQYLKSADGVFFLVFFFVFYLFTSFRCVSFVVNFWWTKDLLLKRKKMTF